MLAERAWSDVAVSLDDPLIAEALANAGAPQELDALAGTALETADPPRSRAAWKRYVEGVGGKGPWAEHARRHAAASVAGASVTSKPKERP